MKTIRFMVLIVLVVFLSGCKSTGTSWKVNPAYSKLLEAGEKPPKDMAIWIPDKKMELKGIGKNVVDYANEKQSKDSSWKMPLSGATLSDMPSTR